MSTEAAIVIIAVAVLLITLLTYLAGRADNRRPRAGLDAAPPGGTPAPAYTPADAPDPSGADEAEDRSLRSERDVAFADGNGHPAEDDRRGGRFVHQRARPRT